jgi:hypothetical protein
VILCVYKCVGSRPAVIACDARRHVKSCCSEARHNPYVGCRI